ncbi:hypothetical protein FACS1894216_02630 [Synergistales bacterium]|nr:hypothetical protein FACS1894216_02630 [Synergistales bacterium]
MAVSYEMMFAIGAGLSGSFSAAFGSASAMLQKLDGKLGALNATQQKIGQYKALKNNIQDTGLAYRQAQAKVTRLSQAIAATPNPSPKMRNELLKAQREAEKLRERFMRQGRELRAVRGEMDRAGISVNRLSRHEAELTARSERLTSAQNRLVRAQNAVTASRNKLASARSDLMASAGWLMALKVPIQTAANFEQAMAKVSAVSGATGEDFKKLSAQARQLGKDTQFTAAQAANSQENLARAGFKTDEIIKTMPALLNMAAAENMDLATAADIAASTLRGYQLEASQASRVSDVLAKTSASTNTSIQTVGESMKMVAPIAAGLKIPFEETVAMIGAMGDAGIKGSEAGTAMRAALIRLSKEPKQTEKALLSVGVAARDSQGNLRTMPSLMQALSEKMKGMGTAARMETLSKIFGTEAASGMLAVMDAANSGKLKELTKTLENAGGSASEMAKIMGDTAQGAMKRLGSAAESLMIDIGNSVLPGFTSVVEKLASVTGKISELAQKYPVLTKVITGGAVALGAYQIASTGVGIAVTAIKLPFQQIGLLIARVNAWMVTNNVTTKIYTATQWLWNKAMSAGRYLLSAGRLLAYKAAQLAVSAATKAWTAGQWLLNAALTGNPIGLVVIAVGALVGAFIYAYKKIDWFREGVDKALKYVKEAFMWAFDGIMSVINKAIELWDKFKRFIGIAPEIPVPESRAVSVPMGENGNTRMAANIQAHAAGGIFSRPHLGLVAEAGTESIIPHKPSGENLWRMTGEQAGFSMPMPEIKNILPAMPEIKNIWPTTEGGDSVAASSNSVFSPTINLTVNAARGSDGNTIGRDILRVVEGELPRLLKRYSEQKERLAYS